VKRKVTVPEGRPTPPAWHDGPQNQDVTSLFSLGLAGA
jgi:hypothetical protein